ncbi:MAG: phosphatidic acid phosphatase [Actinomycetota bacterium]|nr:phosphatidic acid phosphatase [Actinomycetota bacterium]
MAERAQRELAEVNVLRLHEDVDLEAEISRAVEENRTVIAAGGDGTVNAVVQHVVGTGALLGVIPAGTLNHFARDLGVERIDEAFAAIAAGHSSAVDVGRAGERSFVNNATLGIYPEIVRERERDEDRLGKWLALVRAALRVVRRARPLEGTVSADGKRRALFAWILFVGNNRVAFAPGRIGGRPHLDEGVLDVRVMTAGRRAALSRASAAWTVFGAHSWRRQRVVRTDARTLDVDLDGARRAVAFDGETGDPIGSLHVEILPGALRVIRPPIPAPAGPRPAGPRPTGPPKEFSHRPAPE